MSAPTGDEIAFGSDSFLDVMANMVGVLVILVTIAVMRTDPDARPDHEVDPQAAAELGALETQANELDRDHLRLAAEAAERKRATSERKTQCETLAGLVFAQQRTAVDQRSQAELASREQDELKDSLVKARTVLGILEEEAAGRRTKKNSNVIECYPTPISHAVAGREIHFELRGGRITYVPMDELNAAFERDAQQNAGLLRDRPRVRGNSGPIGDYRLEYTLELSESTGGRTRVEASFILIPLDGMRGETIEQALAQSSDFNAVLAGANPRQTTVTVWTYSDSFAMYRAVRKELYGRAWSVACRPMELDQPIGASTRGSRSAAQ